MVLECAVHILSVFGSLLVLQSVGLEWESPEMQDGENGHFYANQKVRNSDFDILIFDLFGRFHGTGRSQERNHGLAIS